MKNLKLPRAEDVENFKPYVEYRTELSDTVGEMYDPKELAVIGLFAIIIIIGCFIGAVL